MDMDFVEYVRRWLLTIYRLTNNQFARHSSMKYFSNILIEINQICTIICFRQFNNETIQRWTSTFFIQFSGRHWLVWDSLDIKCFVAWFQLFLFYIYFKTFFFLHLPGHDGVQSHEPHPPAQRSVRRLREDQQLRRPHPDPGAEKGPQRLALLQSQREPPRVRVSIFYHKKSLITLPPYWNIYIKWLIYMVLNQKKYQ